MTLQEAINNGYKYYVYPDEGHQRLKNISDDIDAINFDKSPMATEKTPIIFNGIDENQIRDLLADSTWKLWNEITGDDTDIIHDLFKEIDFSDVESRIQEKLKSLRYYKQSNIELVKNPTCYKRI